MIEPPEAATQLNRRHWANAEVTENRPLDPDNPDGMISNRSMLTLGNTDNGKLSWIMYGPSSMEIGTPVELFEFEAWGKWNMGYRTIIDELP